MVHPGTWPPWLRSPPPPGNLKLVAVLPFGCQNAAACPANQVRPYYETNPTDWGREKGHFAKRTHFMRAAKKAILRKPFFPEVRYVIPFSILLK